MSRARNVVVKAKPPEIRLNADGTLDEIVAENSFFHLEQMDNNLWWFSIESGGVRYAVWLRARGKITTSYERQD